MTKRPEFHSTTILAVRHKGKVAMGGDGQVTLGDAVMKHGARKVRRLYEDRILTGFAGASADAFALLERFEGKLKDFQGNLLKAATELAKEWRMDRALRRLESLIVAADSERTLLLSGTGDVIEPDDGVMGIGSGGSLAVAAARTMIKHANLDADEIVREALEIAGELCIYTNRCVQVETL